MSLPPQEPPRGPPPLNVSPKSHKIKKTTAGASSSQHPHALPRAAELSQKDWDTLDRIEQYLMSEVPQLPDNLVPPEVVWTVANTQSMPPTNESPRARVGNMPRPELQRRAPPPRPSTGASQSHHPPSPPPLQNLLTPGLASRMFGKRFPMHQQNPLPPSQPVIIRAAPTAAATSHFLPRTPESSSAAAASSFLPNPPPPRMIPDTPSRSIPGPWIYLSPPAARPSISQGPPGYFRPQSSGSLPYIPPPDAAAGRSILQGPPGYFPDKSGSFLPRKPIISPAAGTSSLLRPPNISAAAAARSICPRSADCSPSAPCALSEYSPSASSSTARFPPESSPDGSYSPLTVAGVESYYDGVDSTPPPSPPPPSPPPSPGPSV